MTTRGAEATAAVHQMWATVAGAWGEHADYIDEHAAGMTARMLEATAPQPGDRVLELACGAGGLGLAAAQRVGPAGGVLLSDVVEEMTAIAQRRARERGLVNVRARVLDLDAVDEPDGAHDVVLCREGLMFATDPARAAAEMRRVLRPGGRLAVSVWGPRERNPWLGALLDAVSAELGTPVPPPGVPGPFRLSDRDHLAGLFTAAGFGAVTIDEVAVPRRAGSIAGWWDRTTALTGPLAKRLESLPEDVRRRIRDRVELAVQPYLTAGGALEFPGLALLAYGRAGDG